MLVLTGRSGGEIYLHLPTGERVTVSVVKVFGDVVRLGFTAPKSVTILRRDAINKLPKVSPNSRVPTPEGA